MSTCRWVVASLLTLAISLGATSAWAQAPAAEAPAKPASKASKPVDWEPAIRAFEERDRQSPPPRQGIVFLGSSSVRMWDVAASFPGLPVINRGFGGSQYADAVKYAPRIVIPYAPRVVVIYSGDNDLAKGKSPQQVADDCGQLVAKLRAALPETKLVVLGVKPSPSRLKLFETGRQTNRLIEKTLGQRPGVVFIDVAPPMLDDQGLPRGELFKEDKLHMNAAGYKIWADLLRPHLEVAKP